MSKPLSTLVKLLIACLIVGFLLNMAGYTPEELIHAFPETVASIWRWVVDWGRQAGPYIILGAIVVVPIWVIMVVLRIARGKKAS